jgi:hypothetical protein
MLARANMGTSASTWMRFQSVALPMFARARTGVFWRPVGDHDVNELVRLAILLSYYGITPASCYTRELLIARIGGELVVDHLDLLVHLRDFYTDLIYAYEESALAEALVRVQELALDVVLPLTIAAIQDSQLIDQSIVNSAR